MKSEQKTLFGIKHFFSYRCFLLLKNISMFYVIVPVHTKIKQQETTKKQWWKTRNLATAKLQKFPNFI